MAPASVIRTADFLATLGVDTHIPYTDGRYANIGTIAADLKYLGITQVRDGVSDGVNGSAPLASFITLAQQGIKFTIIVDGSVVHDAASLNAQLALITRLVDAVPGSVIAIEGVNEVNNQPVTYNGVSGLQGAVDLQKALYAAVHSNPALSGIAVDYFTGYGAGSNASGPDPSVTAGLADFDTQHPYPAYGSAPGSYVDPVTAANNESAGHIGPLVYTETGYSSNGGTAGAVDAAVQAKYTLDLVFDTMRDGVAHTDLYDLMDAYAKGSPQGDDGYGLFDTDGSAKPVATAIHNLTAILADTASNASTFQTGTLAPTVTGLPATGRDLVLEKASGTYDIVVWAEPQIWNAATGTEIAATTQTVTISLGATYGTVSVFDPLLGTTAIDRLTNVSALKIGLTDHPLIIEVGALASQPVTTSPVATAPVATAAVTAPAPVIVGSGSDTLVLNLSETPIAGKDAAFTVTVDGRQIGGTQTVTALQTAAQSQDFTFAGNFGSGAHAVAVAFVNGFSGSMVDAGRVLNVNSVTLNGQTSFEDSVLQNFGTTTYTLTTPAPAVKATTSDTLVLGLSETALNGKDAQFMVSVDGHLVGEPQAVTALQGSGQSQNFTFTGSFGAGPHTVSINFLNGFSGTDPVFGRSLNVNSITLDGVTTIEKSSQIYVGAQNYSIPAAASSSVTTAPVTATPASPLAVSIGSQVLLQDTGVSSSDGVTSNGAVTLAGTVAGGAGTVVSIVDGTTPLGQATLSAGGGWTYTTTLASGAHTLHATATDAAGDTASTAAQPTITVETAPPIVTIAAPTETATSTAANITITGSVSGATGTKVELYNGSTDLGAATLNGSSWSYAASLAAGTYTFKAVATDLAGNAATAADAPFTATLTPVATPPVTTAPVTTAPVATAPVTSPAPVIVGSGSDTLVLNLSETPIAGKDAAFTVSVDGRQIGGTQTVTALQTAAQSQDFTFAGTFGSGAHAVAVTFVNGFSGSMVDAGRVLNVNSVTLNGQTSFEDTVLQNLGTVNYTLATPAPAVKATTSDTLVLGLSETALNGKDAQFMVSVDGHLVGEPQAVTALQGSGQSQNFTFTGSFGAGPHTVSINFLNGFSGTDPVFGRSLNVNSITLNGVTTIEKSSQIYVGAQNYAIAAAASAPASPLNTTPVTITPLKATPASPLAVGIGSQVLAQDTGVSSSDGVTSNGAVTLAGTVAGGAGTVVSIVDGTTALGQATLSAGGGWTYTTTLASGAHTLHATATDAAGDTASTAAQPTITVETAPPIVTIAAPTETATSTAANVTITGSVSGATGTKVELYNGSTDLGAATLNGSSWSYAASLAAGTYTFKAIATDLAGNAATAADAPFTATLTPVATPPVTTAPVATAPVTSPAPVIVGSGSDTLVLNLSETPIAGKDAAFTVSVDGRQIGGTQTVTALQTAAQSQDFTFAGTFGSGAHAVAVTFVNGFSGSMVDAGRVLNVNSVTLNGQTSFEDTVLQNLGTVNYTLATPAPAVKATTSDTLVLGLSETALNGKDAQFMVSVDGHLVGEPQAVTALQGSGQSQNFTFTGSFGAGPHTVSINFLNGFSGTDPVFGRSLNVNSITLNGVTTIEKSSQIYVGAQNYAIAAAASAPASLLNTTPVTITPLKATPASPLAVGIGSQVLAQDTGVSSSDGVTSNGAVTLAGTVAGGGGTVVSIVDGTTALGQATLSAGGGWTYTTTLASGAHTLHATATDAAGDTASTAAQPTITVETAPPIVTIAAPTETATSTAASVTITGSVSGTGTKVELYNGSTDLGAATLNGNSWSYAASLAAGTYTFKAIATDLAGNAATAADAPFTATVAPVTTAPVTTPVATVPVTAPVTTPDVLTANVSTGSGVTQQSVTINPGTAVSGTFVPTSAAGTIGASPLVVFNWDPATQLAGFLNAEAAAMSGTATGPATIVAIGDSTTRGFGASALGWTALSYVSEMAQSLAQDGVPTQSDNFLGSGTSISNGLVEDNRIAFVNGAAPVYAIDAGGLTIGTSAAAQGVDFTLNEPGSYNRVTISYIDKGGGSIAVGVNGGPVMATLQLGNTGNTLTQTVDLPTGSYSQLNIRAVNANPTYIQGASFWNSTSAAISVANAGIDGWDSNAANTSSYNGSTLTGSTNGFGETAGVAATSPNLALIDLGINDMVHSEDTTAQTVANVTQMIASLRAAGSDVIIVIPQPFSDPSYASGLPALRAAMQVLSLAKNVPIIDLSATYGDNYAALATAGLMADTLHPDATLYADIGSQIASLLSKTIATTSDSIVASPQTVTGTSGNDTLVGSAATNILAGNGGSDTYVMNATDTNDTIINGTSNSNSPAGQLDILAANHNQLWIERSSNDLILDILGTHKQVTIKDWYDQSGAQLQSFAGIDGFKIDGGIQNLVQTMAGFSTANPGFDPASTTHTTLTDSFFSSVLPTASTAWHNH